MICVYDRGNTAFDKNGDAVLIPISGRIKQIAGGNYDLTMVHPIDPYGKWAHLQPDAIIRAPVPAETITNAYTGMDADVYITTTSAALRSGPIEPTQITYPAWSILADYSVGSKVTFSGQNYECTYWDDDDALHKRLAPSGSSWWRKIANKTSGSPALVNLKAGVELYYVSGPTDGWYKMSTKYGLEGYIKSSQVSYEKHVTPSETQPRVITTQLFRIRTVTVETRNMQVTVNAQHVSYDLNGVLMENLKVTRQPPAQSIAWIVQAFMIDYAGEIATDMVTSTETEYSCDVSGKNGMFMLMDPDQGIVSCFDAELRRDNWDLFVMEKKNVDRGFRLRYGNNLKGVNWKVDGSKLITRVVPVAKAENGDDLFLEDTIWVDSSRISAYPVIRMERLKVAGQVGKDDGTETATNWTAATLRAEMEKQALARFSVDKVDQLQHEITVEFERLGDTVEYAQFKALQDVLLYDTVIVIDDRIDLSVSVTVTELEFDIVKEKITALRLTNVNAYNVKNVSGFNVLNNSITGEKLTDEAGDELIDAAVDEAGEYTDEKAAETLQSSKTYTQGYVGNLHGYQTFEQYIDATYARKST